LICLSVAPIQSGRLVDTPMQAARFVSLIPHAVTRSVGRREEAKVEQWSHAHTILSRGCGDVEDHTTLLCGLLLGLGLDACVLARSACMGLHHVYCRAVRCAPVCPCARVPVLASNVLTPSLWHRLSGQVRVCGNQVCTNFDRAQGAGHAYVGRHVWSHGRGHVLGVIDRGTMAASDRTSCSLQPWHCKAPVRNHWVHFQPQDFLGERSARRLPHRLLP
jgi:hypothetical protein